MTTTDPPQFPVTFGVDTFGDATEDEDGRLVSHAQAIRDVVEQGVLAEQAGLEFFGTRVVPRVRELLAPPQATG